MPGETIVGPDCKPCADSNCADCKASISTCTLCKPLFALDPISKTCIACLPPDFVDVTGACQACQVANCRQCSDSSMVCQTCRDGFELEASKCSVANFAVSQALFDNNKRAAVVRFTHKIRDLAPSSVAVLLYDQDDLQLDAKIESLVVVDGLLLVGIGTSQSVSNGWANLVFTNASEVKSADRPGWTLSQNNSAVRVNKVILNFPKKSATEAVAGAAGGSAVSLVTILTFIVSANYAIMLLKIYQMLNFMLLYNVVYPLNFQRFVQVF